MCEQRGVCVSEIYPEGTRCRHCLKHIETDTTFTIIFNISLLALMFLDFWYLHFDYIGLVCCALLFVFGGPIKWSHPNFIPLRHYADD